MKKFLLGFVTAIVLLCILTANETVYFSFDPNTELDRAKTSSYNSGYSTGFNAGYESGYYEGYSAADTSARQSYVSASSTSVASVATTAPVTQTNIVYVTRTGTKYHHYGCRYLSESCIEKPLADAVAQGYSPCSKCIK